MKYKIIIACMCLFSCGPTYDCDASAEDLKRDECLLIVHKIPSNTDSRFNYKGIHPIAKNECNCNSSRSDRWWVKYKEYIEIGDTIIKRKGELIFSIHKKDSILNFNFDCNGKIYK
jgi:hypothetical protein